MIDLYRCKDCGHTGEPCEFTRTWYSEHDWDSLDICPMCLSVESTEAIEEEDENDQL